MVAVSDPYRSIAGHRVARRVAIAALCAEKQGASQSMHTRPLESEAWRSGGELSRGARVAGVANLGLFEGCFQDEAVADQLRADGELAQEFGIVAIPTFVHRRGALVGVLTAAELAALAHAR